jgi:hypothetical protein
LGFSTLAASSVYFVSEAETVRVAQIFISDLMFTRIDLRDRLRISMGRGSQLFKLTELGFAF